MSSSLTSAPSGRQFTIAHGDWRATAVEVGGGIRSLTWAGEVLLAGYGEEQICPASCGQPLLPWPNRLRDGRYAFRRVEYQLALTEPQHGNAIHGLSAWQRWECREVQPSRVRMGLALPPQPGYPFSLDLNVTYGLDGDGLSVLFEAQNRGPVALPFGAGHHPYVQLGESVDALSLRLPAHTVLTTDERQIPTGSFDVEGGPWDYRSGRIIGSSVLDTAFWDLDRDLDGRARVSVGDAFGRSIELWMDREFEGVMVYTGDTLEAPRRRRALAIEPMTCPPNAFQDGRSVMVLEAGEAVQFGWGLTARGFAKGSV
ncbi:MAG: aldose 1-epimerase family protein [Candidatus Dormibacteraceae bacterium]